MYKDTPPEVLLMGWALSRVRREFGDSIPTLEEYCEQADVHRSSIYRAAQSIEGTLKDLLEQRRPGPRGSPRAEEPRESDGAEEQILALQRNLVGEGIELEGGRIAGQLSRAAVEKVVAVVESIKKTTKRSRTAILGLLGIGERRYRRMRQRIAKAEKEEEREDPPPELLDALEYARLMAPTMKITPFCRRFNRMHAELIQRTTGNAELARSTITRYLKRLKLYRPADAEIAAGEPQRFERFFALAQVVMDTTTVTVLDYKFPVGIVIDCFTGQTLSEGAHHQESSDGNAMILREAIDSFPGIMAGLTDHGTPYRGRPFEREVVDGLMERLLAAAGRPQSKPMIERFNKTLKEWLSVVFESPVVDLGVFPEPVRREVALAITRVVVRMVCVTFNRVPQFWVDDLSPWQRANVPPETSFAEARFALAERTGRNLPKGEVLEEILDVLSFSWPGRKQQREELGDVRLDALREAVERLESIRRQGPAEKDNYRYFRAMAKGIANDIRQREVTRERERERARRERVEREMAKRQWERQAAEDAQQPQKSAQRVLRTLLVMAAAGLPRATLNPFENLLSKWLAQGAASLGSAFTLYCDRFKEEIRRQHIPHRLRERFLALVNSGGAPDGVAT